MKKVRCSTCFIFEKINQTRTFNRFGPTVNARKDIKEAYLIFKVKNRDELMTLLEKDPFWYKGLVSNYTIEEWKPLFGNLEQLTNEEFNDEE